MKTVVLRNCKAEVQNDQTPTSKQYLKPRKICTHAKQWSSFLGSGNAPRSALNNYRVNAEIYILQMNQFNEPIQLILPKQRCSVFLQNDDSLHTTSFTRKAIQELVWEVQLDSRYSPNKAH